MGLTHLKNGEKENNYTSNSLTIDKESILIKIVLFDCYSLFTENFSLDLNLIVLLILRHSKRQIRKNLFTTFLYLLFYKSDKKGNEQTKSSSDVILHLAFTDGKSRR